MDLGLNIDRILIDNSGVFGTAGYAINVVGADFLMIDSTIYIEEFCFLLSCEVKRLAALIYLECCLLNITPEDSYIQVLVRTIYNMLEFIVMKNDFKWCSTLLWSVFVASAEISILGDDCEDLRYLTLKVLDKLETNSMRNVGKTRKIILSIWKRRDLNNYDENSFGFLRKSTGGFSTDKFSGVYLGFINDWEKYVADESYKIALA